MVKTDVSPNAVICIAFIVVDFEVEKYYNTRIGKMLGQADEITNITM